MDIRSYNRDAWNREVEGGNNPWSQPVDSETIAKARNGEFSILLTENIPVPGKWFPPLKGAAILCLASGGGQQGPILAAAGADVTVFDNSPAQLKQDRFVAEREALTLRTVEGDAANLSIFEDESFDLVFNPCSTVFMQNVRAVWKESYRVLRHGGILMTGAMNPVHYIFDLYKADEGILEVAHSIPYSDLASIPKEDLDELMEKGLPLEFGHSLTDLIGGQCEAGFVITDMYEDYMLDSPLHNYHPSYIATRAMKQPVLRKENIVSPKVETSTPPHTPKPIGPYNHIAKVDQFISIGGTAGFNPISGQLAGPDVYSQTKQILESFRVMLVSAASDLEHIVHVNVFLKDMQDFDEMNRAYVDVMGTHRPARTVVGVNELPKPGVLLTMNLTAVTKE